MKPLSKVILVISFLLLTATYLLSTANAAVPHLINYQGRLTDSSGVPLNGSYQLTFRIYDAETAGNLLWEETHAGVVIAKGIFSLMLGSVTDLNIPFDKSYWLEIKVANEVMSPRQRIASSAYAFRAEEADKLGGKPSSDYALASDITSTPTANKAVKLDANAKLPLPALKVYDSGWFAVGQSGSWTKTHNLGTEKVIVQFIGAGSTDGSGTHYLLQPYFDIRPGGDRDLLLVKINSTQITIETGSVGIQAAGPDGGTEVPIRSMRIIMLALE